MADVVAAGDRLYAASDCLGAPLTSPRPDQLALELGEAAQPSEHQATMGGGGVGPGIAQRPEPRLLLGDRREGVEQIPGRSCQPVQPGHHQHVVRLDRLQRAAKLGAVGLRPAATSRNIFSHPASASWRTCAATLWPSVETLAYP
jgi:hypothetical protein